MEPLSRRPLVLLSNDDGHASRGIAALFAALTASCDVVMVAPEHEQSASSHALSLRKPLRLRKLDDRHFALDGTPADCVYVALHGGPRILPRRPDLVLSGLNHGLNLGQDVFYSGTVAAAREAALRGIPSIASSSHTSLDFDKVARKTAEVALGLFRHAHRDGRYGDGGEGRAERTEKRSLLFSLNFPKDWNGDLRATRLGRRIYEEQVDFRKDPYHHEYLWLGGPGVRHDQNPGTDTDAYDEHVASITPLVLDMTSYGDAALAEALAREVGEKSPL